MQGARAEDAAELARAVIDAAAAACLQLATAESLTAGQVVARLVDVPGASRCVAGGAACYALAAKTAVLGVDADLLARWGAVCPEVAVQMARGAARIYGADLAVSTTGVAGPGPDDRGVAEGTVHLAVVAGASLAARLEAVAEGAADADRAVALGSDVLAVRELHLPGDRSMVRAQSASAALELLHGAIVQVNEL